MINKRSRTDIKVGEVFGRLKVLNIDKNNKKDKYKVLCKCLDCGREEYKLSPGLLINKLNKCKTCVAKYIADNRKISHNEYIQKLQSIDKNLRLKEGQILDGINNKLIHICPVCGEDWDTVPKQILHNGVRMCWTCSNSLKESVMATTLKQVMKYYYPDTKWEYDLGFRGKNGGIGQYDIFIPSLNTVIECQSSYHDEEKKCIIDESKKKYAIKEKKMKYISLDSREYTPLEAIQYFFPWIKEIPHYVDIKKNTNYSWDIEDAQKLLDKHVSFSEIADKVGTNSQQLYQAVMNKVLIRPEGYIKGNCTQWDIVKAQKLLNQNFTYNDIVNSIGVTIETIYSAIRDKRLIKPKNYQSQNRGLKIVQLNINGDLVKGYNNIKDVESEGFSESSVGTACKGNYSTRGHLYKDFLWYYKSDYEYIMKNEGIQSILDSIIKKQHKNSKYIVGINILTGELREYEKIIDVKLDGFSKSSVQQACKGENYKMKNMYRDYFWCQKSDYDNILNHCTQEQFLEIAKGNELQDYLNNMKTKI